MIYYSLVEHGNAHLQQSLARVPGFSPRRSQDRDWQNLSDTSPKGRGEGGGKNQILLVQLVNLNSVRGKTKEHLRT